MINNLIIENIVGKNISALKVTKGSQVIWERPNEALGLQVDFDAGTYTRLGAAVGLNPGTDFDSFSMFGGRRRCTVADDGTITSYYGDNNYNEYGNMGQVMVYQPKFYYKVEPLVTEVQSLSMEGYILHKANYYVSETPAPGFKTHPAFFDENGEEIDYVLIGAFEASIYDESTGKYLKNDEQIMDIAYDKLSSVKGVTPATGTTQALTKENIQRLARNRGTGRNWNSDLIKTVSMNQLLCMIEMGTMDFQSAIGKGVVDFALSDPPVNTGSTIGNTTQEAASSAWNGPLGPTVMIKSGQKSVSYRGLENPWGNMYTSVYGINIWGDGQFGGGQPYICKNFEFRERSTSEDYEGTGFTLINNSGYTYMLGYSEKYDWLFMPARYQASYQDSIVKDKVFVTTNLNGFRNAFSGGYYGRGSDAGGFCWSLNTEYGNYVKNYGGRLVYIPTKQQ